MPQDSKRQKLTIVSEDHRQKETHLSLNCFHSSVLPDDATDEDRFQFLLWASVNGRPSTSAPRNNDSSSSVPIFGSTAQKPGMHTQMASMNLQGHGSNGPSRASTPSSDDGANQEPNHHNSPPEESNPPKATRHIQWAGAKSQTQNQLPGSRLPPPPLPPVDELEQQLAADDELFRRLSLEQLYWYTEEESDKWQVNLVQRLVRAKYEKLDAVQHPLVRYARRVACVKRIEEWWRTRKLRREQDKRKEEEEKQKKK